MSTKQQALQASTQKVMKMENTIKPMNKVHARMLAEFLLKADEGLLELSEWTTGTGARTHSRILPPYVQKVELKTINDMRSRKELTSNQFGRLRNYAQAHPRAKYVLFADTEDIEKLMVAAFTAKN